MQVLIFLVCLFASMVGGICGIGGGVIIKPTLDAMGIMSVSTISFLSGLTVLSMSLISVFRQRKNRLVEMRIGSFLAAGAVVGGMIGNALFQAVKSAAGQDDFVGMIQAAVLALVTFLTLTESRIRRRVLVWAASWGYCPRSWELEAGRSIWRCCISYFPWIQKKRRQIHCTSSCFPRSPVSARPVFVGRSRNSAGGI